MMTTKCYSKKNPKHEAERLKHEAEAAAKRDDAACVKIPNKDGAAARLRSRSLDKLLLAKADAKLAELRARPQMEEVLCPVPE